METFSLDQKTDPNPATSPDINDGIKIENSCCIRMTLLHFWWLSTRKTDICWLSIGLLGVLFTKEAVQKGMRKNYCSQWRLKSSDEMNQDPCYKWHACNLFPFRRCSLVTFIRTQRSLLLSLTLHWAKFLGFKLDAKYISVWKSEFIAVIYSVCGQASPWVWLKSGKAMPLHRCLDWRDNNAETMQGMRCK